LKKFRKIPNLKNLTNGPSKLTQALNVTKKLNGLDLTEEDGLYVCSSQNKENFEVVLTTS